jgi:hypothetical protein
MNDYITIGEATTAEILETLAKVFDSFGNVYEEKSA